jgi:hypothetical protein
VKVQLQKEPIVNGVLRRLTRNIWNKLDDRNLKSLAPAYQNQNETLARFRKSLARTKIAKHFGLQDVATYEDYLKHIPVCSYDHYKPFVDAIAHGEERVLYEDNSIAFVQTSGTTGYLNKLIPYNAEMVKAAKRYQYKTGATIATACKQTDPLFDDRFTYATVVRNSAKMVGKIPKANASELLAIGQTAHFGRNKQVLTADVLEAPTWELKLEQIRKAAVGRDVRIMSGIPLYMVGVFEYILNAEKKNKLTDIWPNLEAFFYSGSSVEPYRDQLNNLAGKPFKFFSGYIASEGQFGVPTHGGKEMLFNTSDYLFSFREAQANFSSDLLGIHEVQIGKEYEIFVGCPNGFLNYAVGDLVRIESTSPYITFTVLGRNLTINVANEKTSLSRIDAAIKCAQTRLGIEFDHYFVHPSETQGELPSYVWTLVSDKATGHCPKNLATVLEDALMEQAPDYRDCRVSDGLIGPMKAQIVPSGVGLIEQLLAQNQDKGQFKMKPVFRTQQEFEALLGPAAAKVGIHLMV